MVIFNSYVKLPEGTEIDLNRLVREIIPKWCERIRFGSLQLWDVPRGRPMPGVSSNIMFVSAHNPKLSEHKVISSDWNPLPLWNSWQLTAEELGKPRPIRGSPFKASSIQYVSWRMDGANGWTKDIKRCTGQSSCEGCAETCWKLSGLGMIGRCHPHRLDTRWYQDASGLWDANHSGLWDANHWWCSRTGRPRTGRTSTWVQMFTRGWLRHWSHSTLACIVMPHVVGHCAEESSERLDWYCKARICPQFNNIYMGMGQNIQRTTDFGCFHIIVSHLFTCFVNHQKPTKIGWCCKVTLLHHVSFSMFSDLPNRPTFRRKTSSAAQRQGKEPSWMRKMWKDSSRWPSGIPSHGLLTKTWLQKWMEDMGGVPAKWRHVNLQEFNGTWMI